MLSYLILHYKLSLIAINQKLVTMNPAFRQSSCISDIQIDFKCLEGATFNSSKTELPGLTVRFYSFSMISLLQFTNIALNAKHIVKRKVWKK